MSLSRPSFKPAFVAGQVIKTFTLFGLIAGAAISIAEDRLSDSIEEEIVVRAFRLDTDLSKTGSSISILKRNRLSSAACLPN